MSARLFDVLRFVARCLHDARVPWALVGGLAVSARAEPRFTRDIDIEIDEEQERCRQALRSITQRGANRGKDLLAGFGRFTS